MPNYLTQVFQRLNCELSKYLQYSLHHNALFILPKKEDWHYAEVPDATHYFAPKETRGSNWQLVASYTTPMHLIIPCWQL